MYINHRTSEYRKANICYKDADDDDEMNTHFNATMCVDLSQLTIIDMYRACWEILFSQTAQTYEIATCDKKKNFWLHAIFAYILSFHLHTHNF